MKKFISMFLASALLLTALSSFTHTETIKKETTVEKKISSPVYSFYLAETKTNIEAFTAVIADQSYAKPIFEIKGKLRKTHKECDWATQAIAVKKMNAYIDGLPTRANNISGHAWEFGPTCAECPTSFCYEIEWYE